MDRLLLNGAMIDHRIRYLREQRHLSQEALGELVQKTKHQISRIEKGETKLDLSTARRIAKALDVTLAEVVGAEAEDAAPDAPTGFSDELIPYQHQHGDPLAGLQGGNRYLFTVDTDVMSEARVYRGDVVVIDIGAERVAKVQALDLVQVRLHAKDDFMKPLTLLRQFVPPRLLITNAKAGNLPSINMEDEDAHIVGVVVGSHRRMG